MVRELENVNFAIVSYFVLRIFDLDISIRATSFGVIFIDYFLDPI